MKQKVENILILLFLGLIVLISPINIFVQSVSFYPKDGQIQDLKGKVQQDIVVAKDGCGDFLFIQDAIDAIRVYLPEPITVFIKEGVYKEKLLVPGTITNVTFLGEGADMTFITFDDHTGKNKMQTFDTYTMMVLGNSLTFINLTIENTAGEVGQAVALHAEGDRLVFENCHFKGNQDTMFASGENSRQYYKNCYIEGTTDFIFGSATAYFENCQIHSKSNSYITAASTPEWVKYGYVFNNCQLTAEGGVDQVFLGRPWRDYANTVLGGNLAENKLNLQKASGLTHAGINTPPIIFFNGNQPRFHAGRDDLIAILAKHNIYTEVVELNDAPHTFWLFEPWFDKVVNRISKFHLNIKNMVN